MQDHRICYREHICSARSIIQFNCLDDREHLRRVAKKVFVREVKALHRATAPNANDMFTGRWRSAIIFLDMGHPEH